MRTVHDHRDALLLVAQTDSGADRAQPRDGDALQLGSRPALIVLLMLIGGRNTANRRYRDAGAWEQRSEGSPGVVEMISIAVAGLDDLISMKRVSGRLYVSIPDREARDRRLLGDCPALGELEVDRA
jgi:hypothetical protein